MAYNYLIEPVTQFGQFTELQELDVSESKIAELLSGYRKNLTRPEEKVYLARIQNCVLRATLIDHQTGANEFFV